MKIVKTTLPKDSILAEKNKNYDFVDSYEGEVLDGNQNLDSTKIAKSFFSSGPKWIDQLFDFRNKIVSIFGLKTPETVSNRQQLLDNFKADVGEQLGLFQVFSKTENEVILGENDKHLNFRVSLFLDSKIGNSNKRKIIITTAVIFNNWFGKLYFLPVKPFHKLIVPTMLKAIIKDLEK